ncbi:TPA: hypothetical protein ACL6FC_001372, partial [Streptococcus pneumoniae]
GLTTTLKNAWTTSRQVNFFWVANFNLKFGMGMLPTKTGSLTKKLVIRANFCYNKTSFHP